MQRALALCLFFSVRAVAAIECTEGSSTCLATEETDESSMLQAQLHVSKTGVQKHSEEEEKRKSMKDSSGCTIENNIKLQATLVSGSSIGGSTWMDTVDPFCNMVLLPTSGNKANTQVQSPTIQNKINPTWNFVFQTSDYSCGDVIQFTCYDNDDWKNELIGSGTLPLTRNQATTGHVSLNGKGGTLTVSVSWTTCSGDCNSKQAVMAELAMNVYGLSVQAGNYHLLTSAEVQSCMVAGKQDKMAIYKHYSSSDCALVFTGSNDFTDWAQNLNANTQSMCGFSGVHAGFGGETEGYFKTSQMTSFSQIINSQCGGSVNVVGHSLGGAVASIAAGCLNSPGGVQAISGVSSSVQPFTAKALYTVGAPSVSKPGQITSSNGACFAGERMYNFDSHTYDPVPDVANVLGFVHPMVKAAQLNEDGSTLKLAEYDCTSDAAKNYPHGSTDWSYIEIPNPFDHVSPLYFERAENLFG